MNKVFSDAVIRRGINCFIVGYGGFGVCRKPADKVFSVDMYPCGMHRDPVVGLLTDAVVFVYHYDILVPEIQLISVCKRIVTSRHGKVFDTVSGKYAVLHTIVIYIQMTVMDQYPV